MTQERILCAAIRIPKVNDFVCGYRHANCRDTLKLLGFKPFELDFEDEGFLTSTGRFVDRKQAAKIAGEAGQLIVKYVPDELRSEDLY